LEPVDAVGEILWGVLKPEL
jgi:hypothetical protein